MSAYTKSPWEVVGSRDDEDGLIIVQSASGGVIAHIEPTFGFAQADIANARLLAAAPELLEALSALRSFMWTEGYADQTPEMAQADGAIAKAGGK